MTTHQLVSKLRLLLDRLPNSCLIETDAHGLFTYFGPAAEAFFGCPAGEALGKLRYSDFHDPAELEACRATAAFRAAIRDPGYTVGLWRVIPRSGLPCLARVTLVALWPDDMNREDEQERPAGWLAHYQKASSEV